MISVVPIFGAANDALDQLGVQAAPRTLIGMRASDMILILTVAVLIATALIIWAVYIRKPTTDRDSRVRVHKSRSNTEERDDGTIRKRKKHKRARRAHRSRNPSLAEAGGLPPVRQGERPPDL
jgi:hypothetical protein